MLLSYCMYIFVMGGGARARAAYEACPRTQPAIFTRVLVVDERSDEGEGDTGKLTPSPQAAITIDIHHARSYRIKYVFLESKTLSIVLRALWAAMRDSTRGRGCTAIDPLPRAKITTKTPVRAL